MSPRALLLSMSIGMAACGGGEVLPPVSPAPVAACLTLVLREDKARENVYDRDVQKAVRAWVEEGMVSAGFNVLADPSLPHDLLARIEIEPGSRVESGARVRATLTLESQGKVVDRIEASAAQEAAGYDNAIADVGAQALADSAALARLRTVDLRHNQVGRASFALRRRFDSQSLW